MSETRLNRREALWRAAQLGGALTGVELLLAGGTRTIGEAEARIPGMHSQRSVNVCYSPVKVTSSEALALKRGKRGVYLRKGPGFDHEVVVDHHAREVLIRPGAHVGRQSKRRSAAGCGAAAPRPDVDNWIWCYDLRTRKSGWIPTTIHGHRYSRHDPDWGTHGAHKSYLFGPNDKDFDCRFARRSHS